jgi:hypothetical protein
MTEPTDKSMCRATMMSTIIVAKIPTTAVCWAMLYKFSADKKMPSEKKLKTSAITINTADIKTMRQSIWARLMD